VWRCKKLDGDRELNLDEDLLAIDERGHEGDRGSYRKRLYDKKNVLVRYIFAACKAI
jgi:hypothetical protein